MTVKSSTTINGTEITVKNFDSESLETVTSELEITSEVNEKKSSSKIWRKFAGIVLTIIASFFFSIGSVIVKSISEISVADMTTYRFGILILITLILVTESNESWFGPSSWSWRFWMLVRSVTGTTNIFLFYLAIQYIPLANATIFMLSVPVFVFIFARIILQEPFGKWHAFAMVISTVGIALASKIDFLSIFGGGDSNGETSSNSENSTHKEEDSSGLSNNLIGVILCLICILTMSFVYISLRKIRQTKYSVVLFNFGILGFIEMLLIQFGSILLNPNESSFRIPVEDYNAYWVIGLGLFSFYGQFFLTKACQLEEAGIVSIVRSSSDAVFAFVFQVAFFKEELEITSIIGAILVLASIFFLSFRKYIIDLPDSSSLKKKFRFLK